MNLIRSFILLLILIGCSSEKGISLEKIDYVFLDGGHKYETVLLDLKILTKVIENNGIII